MWRCCSRKPVRVKQEGYRGLVVVSQKKYANVCRRQWMTGGTFTRGANGWEAIWVRNWQEDVSGSGAELGKDLLHSYFCCWFPPGKIFCTVLSKFSPWDC